MKAWGPREPPDDAGRDDDAEAVAARERERNEKIRAIEAAGIDLDPAAIANRRAAESPEAGAGQVHHDHDHGDHDHGDGDHADHADQDHLHPHPHTHSASDEPPIIGIVGAGAVGTALGVALDRGGWPIHAVASRDPERRARFRGLVPGVRPFAEATPLVEEVELIILAVPDDAIPRVAGSLHMYSGQAMVHTSGLLGAEALGGAMAAGTQVGSFHPLVAFADLERAVAALHGATIAIEGDDQLLDLLARMAEAVGGTPVRLAPGAKPAYHAAAVLAAGGFVALLDAIVELGRVAGLDEAGSLAIYGPLIEQTLGNARSLGVAAALTGPMTRGDRGTVARHLATLVALAPAVVPLYLAAAEREIELAIARRALTPEAAADLRSALADALATTT
ncbi:MAG TPA: DUF2520 domain-containing protein [Candidatus Limnocylindrales bacterium]|nr:DUF2520 domain-containing protein [Candidatus Limnocylindrales bacterium]